VILDLRDCAGEEFEEGCRGGAISSVDHGVIPYTQGQKSPKKGVVSRSGQGLSKLPLVVLQKLRQRIGSRDCVRPRSRKTGSGDVVGVKSFGKASLQQLIPLGKRLRPCFFRPRNSIHSRAKVIQGHGITPDVEVVTVVKPCRRR
jgi:C-terminal processing protease CtpA/Prc